MKLHMELSEKQDHMAVVEFRQVPQNGYVDRRVDPVHATVTEPKVKNPC